jgi:ABC-type transporter Mla subunit MlaD
MASRAISRNNVIAGLFVVAGMVGAIAISIAVSGVQKRLVPTKSYIVRFSIAQGAPGLKIGSPVKLGGQEVGRVTRIAFEPAQGAPSNVRVDIAVNSKITLHTDAWAFLELPLLGSMGSINFSRVGGQTDPAHPEQAPAPVLAEGQALQGAIAPPSFLAQAGYGPEQAQELQAIFKDASALVDRARQIAERFDAQLEPGLADARKVLADLGAVSDDLNKRWGGWADTAGNVITKADHAADTLNTALDDADKLVQEARQALADNRPVLDRTLANIDAAVERWKTETLDNLNAALATGQRGVDEFERLGKSLRLTVEQETPNLEKTLANLRLTADQLKLASIEVRRNPWRLLYSPKTKELESELFYDSARTYAAAVSDLRAASEALEALAKGADAVAVNRETVDHITARLDEAFKRYQEAEQSLLKQMEGKK